MDYKIDMLQECEPMDDDPPGLVRRISPDNEQLQLLYMNDQFVGVLDLTYCNVNFKIKESHDQSSEKVIN